MTGIVIPNVTSNRPAALRSLYQATCSRTDNAAPIASSNLSTLCISDVCRQRCQVRQPLNLKPELQRHFPNQAASVLKAFRPNAIRDGHPGGFAFRTTNGLRPMTWSSHN